VLEHVRPANKLLGKLDLSQKTTKISGNLFAWFRNFGSKAQPRTGGDLILPMQEQIKAWRKASRKMEWKIADDEFNTLETLPTLSD